MLSINAIDEVTAIKTVTAAMVHTADTVTVHLTATADQDETIGATAILRSIGEGGIVTDHTIEEIS